MYIIGSHSVYESALCLSSHQVNELSQLEVSSPRPCFRDQSDAEIEEKMEHSLNYPGVCVILFDSRHSDHSEIEFLSRNRVPLQSTRAPDVRVVG